MRPAVLLLAVALALPSCSRQPGFYTPAAIRPAFDTGPPEPGHFLALSDPNAGKYVVTGVLLPGEGTWRWCLKQAELQFTVPRAGGLKFRTEVASGESTFKETGPVRIEISVGGKMIGAVDFEKPESRTVEFDVPPDVIPASGLTRVKMTASKEWIPPEGGPGLGFILTSAGFVQ